MSLQADVLGVHLASSMFSRLDFRAKDSRVVEPNEGHTGSLSDCLEGSHPGNMRDPHQFVGGRNADCG